MFSESAELYDAIYAQFKDYGEETGRVAALLRQVRPTARTVLDVGCGTGEHAWRLAREHGYLVDGLDLDAGLLAVAARKHPAGTFVRGDMTGFRLARRYDAVLCLFSSIAYAGTLARVTEALAAFAAHLAPGGVVVVEPWFAPGELDPTRTMRHEATVGALHVERTSRLAIAGRMSHLTFEYRLTGPDGSRSAVEEHHLGLYTPGEMLAAFGRAGLAAEYDAAGLTGRGLYVARAG